MTKFLLSLTFFLSPVFSECFQMYLAHHVQENDGTVFDIEEYLFGEDNCCDEYPISFCNEGTVYYEKEDYADVSDPANWDVISESVALIRGDSQMLYNPVEENSYNYGVSPINTAWKSRPAYGLYGPSYVDGAGVLAIFYVPKFLPGMQGSFYSYPDDQYYDIHFTSWTSGNGTGWPGGAGDGSGGGGGGGVAYWRSGPIDGAPKIINISDVPNDQGGRVYIHFNRSYIDVYGHPEGLHLYNVKRLDGDNWVNIGSFGGENNPQYIFEASTLLDSTNQGSGVAAYKIVAQTFGTNYLFESEIEYGYSVDNIAPGVPSGLNIMLNQEEPWLMWNPVEDEDFQFYEINRSDEPFFDIGQFDSFATINQTFRDSLYQTGSTVYYRISALDYAGNRGQYSQTIMFDGTATENNPPLNFLLIEPVDGDVINNLFPVLCWEETTDPDINDIVNYIVKIGTDLNNQTVVYDGPFLNDCFQEISEIVENNITYYWSVQAYDLFGSTTSSENFSFTINTNLSLDENIIPFEHKLFQNYPNPFNPLTTINYDLAKDGYVLIEVADVKGNHVKTLVSSYMLKGPRSFQWDAKNKNGETVPAGLYFYTLRTNQFLQTKKMLLLK